MKSSGSDKALALVFRDMPVGCGLDKALAVWSAFIQDSARTLIRGSPLLVPVACLLAWKLMMLAGPVTALFFLLLVLSALFNAESAVSERQYIPRTQEGLRPDKKGSATVRVARKDQRAIEDHKRLVDLSDAAPAPAPAKAPASADNTGTFTGALSSTDGSRALQRMGSSCGNTGASSTQELVAHVHEELYGERVTVEDMKAAFRISSKIRREVGLPDTADDSEIGILNATKEAANVIGIQA